MMYCFLPALFFFFFANSFCHCYLRTTESSFPRRSHSSLSVTKSFQWLGSASLVGQDAGGVELCWLRTGWRGPTPSESADLTCQVFFRLLPVPSPVGRRFLIFHSPFFSEAFWAVAKLELPPSRQCCGSSRPSYDSHPPTSVYRWTPSHASRRLSSFPAAVGPQALFLPPRLVPEISHRFAVGVVSFHSYPFLLPSLLLLTFL